MFRNAGWHSLRWLEHVILYVKTYTTHLPKYAHTLFMWFNGVYQFRPRHRLYCPCKKYTTNRAKLFIWVYIHLKSIKGTFLWWSDGAISIWNAANAMPTTTSTSSITVSLQLAEDKLEVLHFSVFCCVGYLQNETFSSKAEPSSWDLAVAENGPSTTDIRC